MSKADLLARADLDATLTYARQVLIREFNTPIPVAAVSVKPEFDHLFAQWRTEELAPLIADQERERYQAAARKMAILRAQIEARLRQSLADEPGPHAAEDYRATGLTLQTAAGQITDLERRIDALTLVLPRQAPDVLSRAAALISDKVPSRQALVQAFREVTGEAAQDVARDLESLATSLPGVHRQVMRRLDRSDREDGEGLERAATIREVPIPDSPPDIAVPAEGAERSVRPWAGAIYCRQASRTHGRRCGPHHAGELCRRAAPLGVGCAGGDSVAMDGHDRRCSGRPRSAHRPRAQQTG